MKSPRTWPLGAFCAYQIVVTLGLLSLLWYFTFGDGHRMHFLWDGVLPVWVPLGGALGGCFVSLVGVAMHGLDWDSMKYGYWHLVRPLLGMMSGSVAVLALVFVLKGVAPTVMPASGTPFTASGIAVLFVMAFIVGYREETFRELVKRVVDVMLGPGDVGAASRVAIIPGLVEMLGKADGSGSPATAVLTLFNGSQDTLSLTNAPTVDSTPPQALTCVVKDAGTALGPSGLRDLELSWDYAKYPAPLDATITIKAGGYEASARVRGMLQP